MDVDGFLEEVRADPNYDGQIVYVRELEAREARYATPHQPLAAPARAALDAAGIDRLYTHQAQALDAVAAGRDVLVVTGTASGKSLCYVLPIVDMLARTDDATALLLFPTKALTQDQFRGLSRALNAARVDGALAGVCDGDTPGPMRRRLRDHARVILSNPDMLHAAIMPQHGRWAHFLSRLQLLVIDEMHVYSGIFGSNAANLFQRFFRVCRHYGSDPQVVACSATVGNPGELAEALLDRPVQVVDEDGSARGKRTYVFWNPPRVRHCIWRSRRSANVEAHELMAMLVRRDVPTITFSKARMTAEMIHRYVAEKLQDTAPHLVKKVTPYRGGYLPEERREIERHLFEGDLLGVSCTRALELGIDIGGLDASIMVGYPGTLASFFQQSGRAGRQERDALVVLVGLDTSVNQYVMSRPDYLFDRPIERAVVEPHNPFVVLGHLRCAAQELPVQQDELHLFGPHSQTVLRVLEENRKVNRIEERWYHAASEIPQHEVSLRNYSDANVTIRDVDTGEVLGEVDKFDAPPILHPEAIYMHRGDTYRVLDLDLERRLATVKRVEVDYYTQPLGGTDVHHVDHRLREKPFGTGRACWGEVTAYFRTRMYEKVHFYSLDAISRHGVDLPTMALDTMAVWLVPPEKLMEQVRHADLDAHSGLRGIGYATRMLLPAFMTCDTLDFSHSIGSVNSPWNAIFIYERYPYGLGFTEKAYGRLHEIMPSVLELIRNCDCEAGCPCCVGKPLRQYSTWNVERGEGSIPSKASAIMILEGLLGDGTNLDNPDAQLVTDTPEDRELRLERALKRRLERMREPQLFHPIEPHVPTEYPEPEKPEDLEKPDPARRAERKSSFHKRLRKRIAKHISGNELPPETGKGSPPRGMSHGGSNKPPTHFPGRPGEQPGQEEEKEDAGAGEKSIVRPGDPLAARVRRLKRKRDDDKD